MLLLDVFYLLETLQRSELHSMSPFPYVVLLRGCGGDERTGRWYVRTNGLPVLGAASKDRPLIDYEV